MQSTFDERNWLAWLVKVRIIILTFLLGIELAVSRLADTRCRCASSSVSCCSGTPCRSSTSLLLSFWEEQRLQAVLQVVTDLVLVSLVVHVTGGWDSSLNFLYPLVIIVACILLPRMWAYLSAGPGFILYGAVLELNYYGVVPSYATTHPELKALQAIIFVNLFAYLGGGVSGRSARAQASPGRCSTEGRERRARESAGPARKHHSVHQRRTDHHRPRRSGDLRQRRGPASARRDGDDLLGKPVARNVSRSAAQVGSERAHGEVRFQPAERISQNLSRDRFAA